MKTIGFVDYYLSEWHANNYVGWIEKANEELGTDYRVAYGWAELDVSPVDGVTTKEWCEKFGVQACATVEELCEKSDVIMILAPSDPDKHLAYCKAVFPCGKRVYVDKTFAPDLPTAKEIFALGEKYSTPFFSTSALRYTEELDGMENVAELILTGGGSTLQEYVIHQVENMVRLLGTGEKKVTLLPHGNHKFILVDCADGVKASMVYSVSQPFTATVRINGGKEKHYRIKSDMFGSLMQAILKFFENGELPFDSKQTLAAMALRDAVLAADAEPGKSFTAEEVK